MPYPTHHHHHHSLFSSFTASSTFHLPPNAVASSEFASQIGGEMRPAENWPAVGDCFVDQLLNLNADVDLVADNKDQEDMQTSNAAAAGVSPSPAPFQPPPPVAGKVDLGSVLTIPEEEPHLEWLSHFIEDSFSPSYPAGARIPPPPENPAKESEAHNASLSSFSPPAAVPRSRRSKRPRSAAPFPGKILPAARSPPSSSSLTESTATSSSCSSATSSPWPPTSPSTPLSFHTREPNPNKKQKASTGPGSGSGPIIRKCSHCGVQKTPQWRAGPMGSKTLCNACGVRFKSGRLFPEYRPACSPTFSSELHSNSHRKVLEMRMKKEVAGQPEPAFGSGLLFGDP